MSESGARQEPQETKQKRIVAEIGPGSLPFFTLGSRTLDAKNEIYVGIDGDKWAAEYLHSNFKQNNVDSVGSLHADAAKMPFGDSTVDEIIATNIFGDVTTKMCRGKDDLVSGTSNQKLAECSRVLKKGGKLVITETVTPRWALATFFEDFEPDNPPMTGNIFLRNNFSIERISRDEPLLRQYDNSPIERFKTRPKDGHYPFQIVLIRK